MDSCQVTRRARSIFPATRHRTHAASAVESLTGPVRVGGLGSGLAAVGVEPPKTRWHRGGRIAGTHPARSTTAVWPRTAPRAAWSASIAPTNTTLCRPAKSSNRDVNGAFNLRVWPDRASCGPVGATTGIGARANPIGWYRPWRGRRIIRRRRSSQKTSPTWGRERRGQNPNPARGRRVSVSLEHTQRQRSS